MFEEVELQDGGDEVDCGVKCELHSAQCDFFGHSGNKCYFGIYSQTNGIDVVNSEVIKTYHKSGIHLHYYRSRGTTGRGPNSKIVCSAVKLPLKTHIHKRPTLK